MQLMPDTAKQYGLSDKDRFNPEKNIRAGAKHLRYLEKHAATGGQVSNMVMAYNMGEGALGKRSAEAKKAGVDVDAAMASAGASATRSAAHAAMALSTSATPTAG